MQLKRISMDEEKMKEICSWKYEEPYQVYDLPPCEIMIEPERLKHFYAYYEYDQLVGFINLQSKESKIFLGIGVKPDLCGRSFGRTIIEDGYFLAKELYPDLEIALEVRTWNQRAIRCYEKAGFQIDGEPYEMQTCSGPDMYYRMIKRL